MGVVTFATNGAIRVTGNVAPTRAAAAALATRMVALMIRAGAPPGIASIATEATVFTVSPTVGVRL
jgi:hypothetical protein